MVGLKYAFLVLLILGVSSAYTSSGNAFYCNGCDDCTAALNDNAHNIVYLGKDIVMSGEDKICIERPENFTNKIFDCQGHKITGNDGIIFSLDENNGNTIRNCVAEHFLSAFNLNFCSGNILENNLMYGGHMGIRIFYSFDNNFVNNTVYDVDFGLDFYNSNNNDIKDNTVYTVNLYGFYLSESSNNFFKDNTAYNAHSGFVTGKDSGSNIFYSNTAYDNEINGFVSVYLTANDSFTGNSAYNNDAGFLLSFSSQSRLNGNNVCGNNIDILVLDTDSTTENTNLGNGNICDSVQSWNDEGATGCTYACSDAGTILPDVVPDKNYLDKGPSILDSIPGISEEEYNKTSYESRCDYSAGRFIIATSFNRICDDDCEYESAVSELAQALNDDCYTVEIIDLDLGGTWSTYDEAKTVSEKIKPKLKEVIGDYEWGTYLFILGDYYTIPPCVYYDGVESSQGFLFFGGEDYYFLSDDCYGTDEDGPAEIVISRLPTPRESAAVAYLDRMTEYHISKANGIYGLNKERLEDKYGPRRIGNVIWYYLMSSRDQSLHAKGHPEIKSYEIPGPSLFGFFDEPGEEPDMDAYPIHYYMLHGNFKNTRWSTVDNVTGVTNKDTFPYPFAVLSLACYGGSLYGDASIPPMWMFNGYTDVETVTPNVFIGSTRVSYFGNTKDVPVGSDIFFEEFHGNFDSGMEIGNAFLMAKKEVYGYDYDGNLVVGLRDFISSVKGDAKVKAINRKVALEYQLYGDPLLTKWDMTQAGE